VIVGVVALAALAAIEAEAVTVSENDLLDSLALSCLVSPAS
jgi:hypothetical protein